MPAGIDDLNGLAGDSRYRTGDAADDVPHAIYDLNCLVIGDRDRF
jgi:hypothetical protein